MAIVHPWTGSSKSAQDVLARMDKLLTRRMLSKIRRRVFLVAWRRLRTELERTPEYQAFRSEVLQRDGYRCRSCGRSAHTVHHHRRVARAVHLALDPRNASVICDSCHAKVHPQFLRRAS